MNSINLVEEVLNEEHSKPKEIPKSLYPSKASVKLSDGTVIGECLRKLYYEYTGEKPSDPLPIKAIYKMAMGTKIHEWFLEKLKQKGNVETEVELQLKDDQLEREIHGRIDAFKKDDSRIVEIKTTFGMGFKSIPKPEHKLQIRIYDKLKEYSAKLLELVYIARDSANRESFLVTLCRPGDVSEDGLTYESALTRWVELEKKVKENNIPDRDFKEKEWQCVYCQYHTTCYAKGSDGDW